MAKLLLACGADINAKESKYGQTPLQLAVTEGHTAVADFAAPAPSNCFRVTARRESRPIAVSSPDDPDGIDDFRTELKCWRDRAIMFFVTLIAFGVLVWAFVKFFMEK